MGLFPLASYKSGCFKCGSLTSRSIHFNSTYECRFFSSLSLLPCFISGVHGEWMSNLLLWTGMLEHFDRTIYILFVGNLKRMGAYSGLEHIGLVAVGLSSEDQFCTLFFYI